MKNRWKFSLLAAVAGMVTALALKFALAEVSFYVAAIVGALAGGLAYFIRLTSKMRKQIFTGQEQTGDQHDHRKQS